MSNLSSHSSEEIVRFLEAVDEVLVNPESLLVIGGAAAVLHYKIDRATEDIDTFRTHKTAQCCH